MDDATRAELAELRRRAFGPTPDIADDPAAMERLAVLEDLSQDEHAAQEVGGLEREELAHGSETIGTDAEPFALATHPLPVVPAPAEGSDLPPSRRRRSGAGVALGAAVIATLVVVSTAVALPPQSGVRVTTQDAEAAYALSV